MTDPVSIGAIRLYDEVLTTLTSGIYRARSALAVRDVSLGTPLDPPPDGLGVFDVGAPRFTVDSNDIVSRHPPRSASGEFGDRLPHVALGRRTLPWERRLADGTPWLALILVRAEEADLVTMRLRTGLDPVVVAAMEAAEPIQGDPEVVLLKVKDLAVFRAILPARADVRLLAHARQVNTADTALAGNDDDGWFAVVTANRLPVSAADPVPYLVCLVSLEARDDVWTAPGPHVPPLIVLNSWTFTSGGSGGTFEHLAAHLDLAPFGAPAAGAAPVADAQGSVSLARTLRDGSPAPASYRSPLLGIAPDQPPDATEDVTSAAARELGLLLAGADGRFLREMVAWQRSSESIARSAIARAELFDALAVLETQTGATVSAVRAAATRNTPADTEGDDEPAGAVVSRAVLDVLRRVHDQPADLWQPHPAGLRLVARQAGLPSVAALRAAPPGADRGESE